MIGRWLGLVLALAAAHAAGAAVLEGYVVEQQSGRPVARARVTLQTLPSAASGAPGPLFTDSRGFFSYRIGRAGAILLTAEKRGYAPTYYGQRRWNGPGTPIVLEGDSTFRVEVRLRRLGAVSGVVADENGVGLADVPVFAYRDTKPLRLAGRGATDDRGVFRVAGLEPGRYRVRTGAKQLEDGTGLLPTFFGDTTAAEGSSAVEANLDQETGEVFIRPAPGTLLKLSGRVSFAGAGTVALYSDMGRAVAPVDSSGRFSFDELTPGAVQLVAESSLQGRPQVGYASLWLTSDLSDVVLAAATAPAVSFRCEDRDAGALRAKDVSLRLTRISPPDDPRTQDLACGTSAALDVGEWQVQVSTPPKYAVTGLSLAGRPFTSNSVPLIPGGTAVIGVTVTAKGAGLKGSLTASGGQPAAGAMVFVRALDPAVNRLIYNKGAARTDANGDFVFAGLPAGRYQVAGSFDVQTATEIDWTAPSLAVVELTEGEEAAVSVRL